jgi:polyhydroxybutyrate depolymerase
MMRAAARAVAATTTLLAAAALSSATARADTTSLPKAPAPVDDRGYEVVNRQAKPAPLVVVLHCFGCPPSWLPQKLGLEKLAKEHGFVVAIPVGHSDSQGNPFWNATAACCDFDDKRPDDIGYVTHVIDELVSRGVADPRRVYVLGFSNGGFLAHRLACEQAGKIAAIASIGGGAPTTCTPPAPVAVLEVHGQADEVVPAGGGKLGGGVPPLAAAPSLQAALAPWLRIDRCGAPDSAGHRRCERGAVELWTPPGGHWPTTGSDFGERLWQWLAAQHK